MLISIGILAYNESEMIEATLASLFMQTVFQNNFIDSDLFFEIIIVPNGCNDDTAGKARSVLQRLVDSSGCKNITWKIEEITEAGKSKAWNRYIHEFSSLNAEIIVMMDSDIEFGEDQTIENCVKTLLDDQHAVVVVDQPLKDAFKKTNQTLIQKMSLAVSKSASGGAVYISGQFYCARANKLREIWMPSGLPVEDGFLYAMIVTDCFRQLVDTTRVVRAQQASHYFETLTSPSEIFKHELRLVIGNALNCYLTWDLLHFATDPKGPGAGVAICNHIARDPLWFNLLMENAVKNRGFWVLPRGSLFRKFSGITKGKGLEKLKKFAVSLVGFFFDLPVLVAANHIIKRKQALGFW